MGEPVVEKLDELARLDEGVHWFCPRANSDDYAVYFDEDVLTILDTESAEDRTIRQQKIKEANKRRDDVLEASEILAYDGAEAKLYQERFERDLRTQLVGCDICVREFHRARPPLQQGLEAKFGSEDVHMFMDKFDAMNKSRIEAGLNMLTESLRDLPLSERSISSAGSVGLYALFEALNCVPFLLDEEVMEKCFNRPFKLVQTNRKLKLPSYAPGMSSFLFSHNEEWTAWAAGNFSKIKRPLTDTEFEYSVKPFLENAMARVNITFLDEKFLPQFWRGTKLIVAKLTKALVTNHLRAMDTNLYTLALEHFQIRQDHFSDLLLSYQILLRVSPGDFWEAMGTISAQAVIDTIFRAPKLDEQLKTTLELVPLQLEEKMQWTVEFVKTIKSEILVPPARSIIDQLLVHLQGEKYSKYSRSVNWEKGFICILESLKVMKTVRNPSVRADMVQIVSKDYISSIMSELIGIEKKSEIQIEKTEQICLDIVETALALEVENLAHDRRSILRTNTLDHEIGVSDLNIWKMSMRHVKPGHPILAITILFGISGLLPLEKFSARQVQNSPKEAQSWNHALSRMLNYVCEDLLERLDSFSPDQLTEMFVEQKAASGLVMLLLNGEARVHQAALNVLKGLSGEDTRRDVVMHIINAFTSTTLRSLGHALEQVSGHRTFAPCSISLKICTDVFSCLCDTQDGILRSRTITQRDAQLLEKYWERIWQLLGMIFEQTEPWSNMGHGRQMMQDFCRETMDFADYAFDQYSILASTLQGVSQLPGDAVRKTLLERPKLQFSHISKWLRLRDEYLVSKAVGLAGKILGRLQEVGIEIEINAVRYLQNVVTSAEKDAAVKTNLSMQQKAELQRALEKHLGETLHEIIDVDALSASRKQTNLQEWVSSGKSMSIPTAVRGSGASKPKQRAINVEEWSESARQKKKAGVDLGNEMKMPVRSVSSSADAHKARLNEQPKKPLQSATTKAAMKHQPDKKNFLAKRQKEKEEFEKRRLAAIAKANGVAPEGSVPVLNDLGKDETLKGQNVMVSSDEESEDDDDDDIDADLFGESHKERKNIQRSNVDPNGAVGLKPEQKKGPTRIQRTARSLKDMRARLAPDLTLLHRDILKWDFFHDGDYPPGANEYHFRAVANTFNDPTTYQETFQPLLTLEAWQGMVKSREENTNKAYEVKIHNRVNVDNFVEISTMVGHAEMRELGLMEGDVVLLSKAKKPAEDASAPHCLARIYRVKRQKSLCEVVYQVIPTASLAPSLTQQSIVHGLKIQTLTPLEREYGALQGLQYYDLCNQIVRARPSQRIEFSDKQVTHCQDVWNVNRAQSEAINAALQNEGFSLIQGPPGSGKTKTIIAIVGGLLSHVLGSSSGGTKISMPKAHGNQSNGNDAAPRKLLVCAPSNAAVDELVMRLKEGVKTRAGVHHQLNVVRIGRSDAMNQQVVDVSMDELVAKRIGNSEIDRKTKERNTEMFREHGKVSSELAAMFKKQDSGEVSGHDLSNLQTEIAALRKKKNELGVRIDNIKDTERNAGREAELNRKKAQQAVLDEAHVICATLSGSGHDMFQSLNIEFETVIIDEAAQCVEMSSLIPLKYGCVKCIMVGDPKQLPPTVFSKEAARFQYEQSLFVRMQNNFSNEVHLLDTQYRMHPQISVFPSQTFYDALLKDGPNMEVLRKQPWHASALLSPYRFFDVAGQHQAEPKGHSLVNLAEIDVAMALYARLTKDHPEYDFTGSIGIITPYKSQLKALKNRFEKQFGSIITDNVEFNTTDAFQGRESEIIIFSCVRASPSGGIGFLQDIRRMNVGLTRAKSSLWVLGNSGSLVRGQFWKKLVEDAHARDCYTAGNLIRMLKTPSSMYPATKDNSWSMLDVSSHVSQFSQMDRNGNSRQPSSNGTLGNSAADEAPAPKITEQRHSGAQDSDRMEGISYRFEDRISQKKKSGLYAGSNPGPSVSQSHAEQISIQEDIDMEDADDIESGDVTLPNTPSTTETPTARKELPPNPDNGAVIPGAAHAAPPVPPPRLKKRPTATPFMPRKQQRPRP